MNNDNEIKLINENGAEKTYGRIPDLWHVAELLDEEGYNSSAEAVREVWMMAHDLKSVIEGQGQAKLVAPAPAFEIIEAKRNTPLVLVRDHGKVKFMQKQRINPAALQAHYAARKAESPVGQA